MDRGVFWLRAAWNDFVAFLPDLVLGIVILAVGWLAARVLSAITRPVLHRVGFDRLIGRLGLARQAERTEQGARWGSAIVFWIVLLVAVMYAADVWRLGAVAAGIAAILMYVPHLIGAAVIFGAALAFGNWVRDRVLLGSEETPLSQRPLLASLIRAAILALGAFMALREMQIAPEIVTLAFSLTLGAVAVAAALAFGLGSRDVAGRAMSRWYDARVGKRDGGDESHIIKP